MEPPISVMYRWTEAEYLAANRFNRRRRVHPVFRWAANGAAGLALVAALVSLLLDGVSAPAVVLGVAALYWFGLRQRVNELWLARRFRRRPDRDEEVRWSFGEEEISSRSAHGEGRLRWTALVEAVETPRGFLIYPNREIFLWLPYDGFAGQREVEAFRELAKARIADFTEVR
jgi:hypothetical protein